MITINDSDTLDTVLKPLTPDTKAVKGIRDTTVRKYLKRADSALTRARKSRDISAGRDSIVAQIEALAAKDAAAISPQAREIAMVQLWSDLHSIALRGGEQGVHSYDSFEEHKQIIADSKGKPILNHMVNWYGDPSTPEAFDEALADAVAEMPSGDMDNDDIEPFDRDDALLWADYLDDSDMMAGHIAGCDKGGFINSEMRKYDAAEVITLDPGNAGYIEPTDHCTLVVQDNGPVSTVVDLSDTPEEKDKVLRHMPHVMMTEEERYAPYKHLVSPLPVDHSSMDSALWNKRMN